eukprot:655505_1
MPDKFKIKMDDQNRLHIWINRHTIKYQEWDSNLVATIPLHTSSEMKYLQWVDYSEENVSQPAMIAQLFDPRSEQTDSDCWWIASLNDKDSIHFENSMQWVMRTSSKDCRCIVYNCTGVNWCELCPTRDIKRTKQKRTVNGHVEPVCPLHQPPREKHLEKCSFICIVYEDARMAKDREFCRFIIRLRHHTGYCSKFVMKAKPSSSAWVYLYIVKNCVLYIVMSVN